jgi:hypothetical protein
VCEVRSILSNDSRSPPPHLSWFQFKMAAGALQGVLQNRKRLYVDLASSYQVRRPCALRSAIPRRGGTAGSGNVEGALCGAGQNSWAACA